MADEMNTGVTAETDTAAPAAPTPVVKKTRGPNRKKIAVEAVAATSATETPVKKTRAKRGEKAAAAQLVKAAKAEKATKAPRARATVTKPSAATPARVIAAAASDEFSDLLKLEEENKLLRKELGDKLRAENADLKKKLGKG